MESKISNIIDSEKRPLATWNIASILNNHGKRDTPAVLKIMKKLEREGAVKRHYATTKNNIVWIKSEEDL